MGQPCDTYVLENSQLNTSVNTLNNRTETLNEEVEDPLNEHRSPASETWLQSVIPDYPVLTEENQSDNSNGREIYNIAPGEKNTQCL